MGMVVQQPLAFKTPDPAVPIRPVAMVDVSILHETVWSHHSETRCRSLVQQIIRARLMGRGIGIVAENPASREKVIAYGQIMRFVQCSEISNLAVDEPHRSQGIGTAMIQHLVAYGQHSLKRCIEIGVELSNERALKLYRRLGFEDHHTLTVANNQSPILYLRLKFA